MVRSLSLPGGPSGGPVLLASYNIHGCVGRDGRRIPLRTVEVLEELDADVVALQEVDSRLGTGPELLEFLSERTGMFPVSGPTILDPSGQYGNALLTRLPVNRLRRIDLSVADREPRGALDVDLAWNGRLLRVIGTHLGLRPSERREQVRRLLPLLASEEAGTTVLMGDINEWFLWGRPLRWLHARFGRSGAPATFPARFPVLALDRIWVTPARHLQRLEAHDTRLSRLASDHLPIKARILSDAI